MSTAHVPVLLNEVIAALNVRPGLCYVDATFGRGGYSRAILAQGGRVYGIDRDPEAIAAGQQLASSDKNFTMLHGTFGDLQSHLATAHVAQVDGIAFDIGVSSPQIDEANRGFSFRMDGPLDMRMDPTTGRSAADLVNTLDEEELADILYHYGEERHSRRIARAIVAARPITRTTELRDVIHRVMPPAREGIDPATRSFQALRIAVNDELGELERGLAAAEQVLAPGGRLAVVSFHSLEDRIVKDFLRERSGRNAQPIAPPSGNRFKSCHLVTHWQTTCHTRPG
jgi:16S rRNA (cytosine1402-N4)-methyltransferase